MLSKRFPPVALGILVLLLALPRSGLAQSAGQARMEEAQKVILEYATTGDQDQKALALQAAGETGQVAWGTQVIQESGALSAEAPALLRQRAIVALGRLGATDLAETIAGFAGDPDSYVRAAVAEALGRLAHLYARSAPAGAGEPEAWTFPEAAVTALKTLAGDDSPFVRTQAAQALGWVTGEATEITDLLAGLAKEDPETSVRQAAATALGFRIEDPAAARALVELINRFAKGDETDTRVGIAIINAAGWSYVQEENENLAAAVTQRPLLAHTSPEVRMAVIDAASHLAGIDYDDSGSSSAATLLELVNSRLEAGGNLPPQEKSALETLLLRCSLIAGEYAYVDASKYFVTFPLQTGRLEAPDETAREGWTTTDWAHHTARQMEIYRYHPANRADPATDIPGPRDAALEALLRAQERVYHLQMTAEKFGLTEFTNEDVVTAWELCERDTREKVTPEMVVEKLEAMRKSAQEKVDQIRANLHDKYTSAALALVRRLEKEVATDPRGRSMVYNWRDQIEAARDLIILESAMGE